MTLDEVKFSALAKTIMKASFMSPDVYICIRDMMHMTNDELKSLLDSILKEDNDFTGINYVLMGVKMQHISMCPFTFDGGSEFADAYEKTMKVKFLSESLGTTRVAIKYLFDKDPSLVTKEREDDLVTIYSDPLDDKDIEDIREAVKRILKSFK